MPSRDAWEWPYMLFCAMKFLNIKSEVDFWRMRPRTYFALLTIAMEHENRMNGGGGVGSPTQSVASDVTTIDNIPGF